MSLQQVAQHGSRVVKSEKKVEKQLFMFRLVWMTIGLVHGQGLWLTTNKMSCYVQFSYSCESVPRIQCELLAEARSVNLSIITITDADKFSTGCSLQPESINWNPHHSTATCTSDKMCVCSCFLHPLHSS